MKVAQKSFESISLHDRKNVQHKLVWPYFSNWIDAFSKTILAVNISNLMAKWRLTLQLLCLCFNDHYHRPTIFQQSKNYFSLRIFLLPVKHCLAFLLFFNRYMPHKQSERFLTAEKSKLVLAFCDENATNLWKRSMYSRMSWKKVRFNWCSYFFFCPEKISYQQRPILINFVWSCIKI